MKSFLRCKLKYIFNGELIEELFFLKICHTSYDVLCNAFNVDGLCFSASNKCDNFLHWIFNLLVDFTIAYPLLICGSVFIL